MKNNRELVFGRIGNDRSFADKGFGFAQCSLNGQPMQIFLHLTSCREVVADEKGEPVFSNEEPRHEPRRGDEIVAVLLSEKKPWNDKAWPAACWGYRKDWDAIQNAPYYRVVVNNRRFNDQPEKITDRTAITAEGKLGFLQSQHPCRPDGENDRLGNVYKSGPVTEWQSWERFVRMDGDKEVWEPCADPRSKPCYASPTELAKSGNCHEDWVPGAETKTGNNGNGHVSAKITGLVVTTSKSVQEVEEEAELLALANGACGQRAGTTTVRPR